jgi:hypothetical protein
MDLTRLIARKVILSVDLAVVSTLLMYTQRISDTHWLWAMTATVCSFIAAETIQKKKLPNRPRAKLLSSLWVRIQNVFSLDFIAALLVVNVAHYFVYSGIIQAEIWFMLIPMVVSFYNIGNSLTKQEEQQ